jgi:hypothetical protein
MLLVSLLATACAQSGANLPSSTSSGAGSAYQAPITGGGAFTSVSWQRPASVAPLEAQGKFQVIAENQWPGDKVRVFFWGVQG